jgi:hypothetical protein
MKTNPKFITASADAIMALTIAPSPSHTEPRKVATIRGIPSDLILRTLAEEVSAPVAAALREDLFSIQHVAPDGTMRVGAKIGAVGVRAALRCYLATRGTDGERLHVRRAGGTSDGALLGLYRAERGAWKTVSVFVA